MAPELPICNDQGKSGPPRLGNWKMDPSTNREVICTKCQVQIDGRAVAISATECICLDCWQSSLQGLINEIEGLIQTGRPSRTDGQLLIDASQSVIDQLNG